MQLRRRALHILARRPMSLMCCCPQRQGPFSRTTTMRPPPGMPMMRMSRSLMAIKCDWRPCTRSTRLCLLALALWLALPALWPLTLRPLPQFLWPLSPARAGPGVPTRSRGTSRTEGPCVVMCCWPLYYIISLFAHISFTTHLFGHWAMTVGHCKIATHIP